MGLHAFQLWEDAAPLLPAATRNVQLADEVRQQGIDLSTAVQQKGNSAHHEGLARDLEGDPVLLVVVVFSVESLSFTVFHCFQQGTATFQVLAVANHLRPPVIHASAWHAQVPRGPHARSQVHLDHVPMLAAHALFLAICLSEPIREALGV